MCTVYREQQKLQSATAHAQYKITWSLMTWIRKTNSDVCPNQFGVFLYPFHFQFAILL